MTEQLSNRQIIEMHIAYSGELMLGLQSYSKTVATAEKQLEVADLIRNMQSLVTDLSNFLDSYPDPSAEIPDGPADPFLIRIHKCCDYWRQNKDQIVREMDLNHLNRCWFTKDTPTT